MTTVTQAEIESIKDRECSWRLNCGLFGHVAQDQAARAFADIGLLLYAIAERDARIQSLEGQIDAQEARIECADIPMIDECDIKEWHHIATHRKWECDGIREDLANYRASAEEQIEEYKEAHEKLYRSMNQAIAAFSEQQKVSQQLRDQTAYLTAERDELRRPSDAKEIAQIQERQKHRDDVEHMHGTNSLSCVEGQRGSDDCRYLLSALAESQRECARLMSECANWKQIHENNEECIKRQHSKNLQVAAALAGAIHRKEDLEAEIARLQSPPEERRDIVQRHEDSREWDSNRIDFRDMDTLLEDCARHRNAHIVNMARADAAEQLVAQLKSDLQSQISQRLESGQKFAACLLRADAAEAKVVDLQQFHDWAEPQVIRIGEEIVAREAAEKRVRELHEALQPLIEIIDKAGLLNLSNGVQLGQTSWYVKANDRLEFARSALASPLPEDTRDEQAQQMMPVYVRDTTISVNGTAASGTEPILIDFIAQPQAEPPETLRQAIDRTRAEFRDEQIEPPVLDEPQAEQKPLKHIANENGDCVSWCAACRASDPLTGLQPGEQPQAEQITAEECCVRMGRCTGEPGRQQ